MDLLSLMSKIVKKIARLTREAVYALFLYRNPFTYYAERFHRFPAGQEKHMKLRNGLVYSIQTGTPDVNIIEELWSRKIYDRLLSHIKPGSVVVDIGAQIGVFSIKAASCDQSVRVFSFEPFPQNFAMLTKNIELNKFEGRVIPFNQAVAASDGAATFYIHTHDSGGGSIYPHGDPATIREIKVPTVTLAHIFEKNKITQCAFMKIDCEGAELDIVRSAPRELFDRIASFTIEWHDDLNRDRMPLPAFKKFLEERGFKVDFEEATGTLYAWKPSVIPSSSRNPS